MRKLLLTSFVFYFLHGCVLLDKSPDDPSNLIGNWFITAVKYQGPLPDSLVGKMEEKTTALEMNSISLRLNNKAVIDDWSGAPEHTGWRQDKDRLSIDTKTITLNHAEPNFKITELNKDVLRLQHSIPVKRDTLRILYLLRKFKPSDTLVNIFADEANQWRVKPPQPETDAALKKRTADMLEYYASYFDVLFRNEAPFFNNEKMLNPLRFYNGGIGLKHLEEYHKWKLVYYNDTDAAKAHKMLERAFSSGWKYPNKNGEFVKEYIIALRILAGKVRELSQ